MGDEEKYLIADMLAGQAGDLVIAVLSTPSFERRIHWLVLA